MLLVYRSCKAHDGAGGWDRQRRLSFPSFRTRPLLHAIDHCSWSFYPRQVAILRMHPPLCLGTRLAPQVVTYVDAHARSSDQPAAQTLGEPGPAAPEVVLPARAVAPYLCANCTSCFIRFVGSPTPNRARVL